MINLWKQAVRNNNLSKLLWVMSVSLGVIAFLICFGLHFAHYGFDKGMDVFSEERYSYKSLGIVLSGPLIYEWLTFQYKVISGVLAFFLIGKFLDTKSIIKSLKLNLFSQIVCFSSLSFALYLFWEIFREKLARAEKPFWNEPYDSLMRDSVPFDWT
jgi:hypothetical protein